MTTPDEDPLELLRSAQQVLHAQVVEADAELRRAQRQQMEAHRKYRDLSALITRFARNDVSGLADQTSPPGGSMAHHTPVAESGVHVARSTGTELTAHGPDGRVIKPKPFDPSEASTREAILYLLETEGRALETSEIVSGVHRLGIDSQPASTRSLVSKMADAEQIRKVRRGLYQHNSLPVATALEQPSIDGLIEMKGEPPEPDYDPAERDWTPPDPEPDPEPTDEEYRKWARDVEQAHLEDQADREETSS